MVMRNRKFDVLAALPTPEVVTFKRRGPQGTARHVGEVLGISSSNVRRYLRQLYALDLIHIGCWNRTIGDWAPVWVQGKGEHAPEPLPLPGAEHSRRSRARLKKALERSQKGFKYNERYKGKVALAKAAEVAQRTRIAPQHWFSPLGL